MDLETLRGIAEIMSEHDLSHIKMDGKDGKIEIDRACAAPVPLASALNTVLTGMPAAPAAVAPACASVIPAAPAAATPAETPAPAPAAAPIADDTTDVNAPMVGVFYAAPAPGADPFVTVGSKVKKGDTLCIVEAMKCMNEIAAECDGVVVDICVSDGELVEYGRCLMKISQ